MLTKFRRFVVAAMNIWNLFAKEVRLYLLNSNLNRTLYKKQIATVLQQHMFIYSLKAFWMAAYKLFYF